MARSKPFSFNTLFRPEPGPYRCQHKKKQVKMLKKKIYKKALQMIIERLGDCSLCPLCDEEGNITNTSLCDGADCTNITMGYWLRQAEQELKNT